MNVGDATREALKVVGAAGAIGVAGGSVATAGAAAVDAAYTAWQEPVAVVVQLDQSELPQYQDEIKLGPADILSRTYAIDDIVEEQRTE